MNSQISMTEITWDKAVQREAGSGEVKKEIDLRHHKCFSRRENHGY